MHCLNRSGDKTYHNDFSDELNEAESLRLCDMIIELNPYSVCLCGGEPLLRADIFSIIKKLADKIQSVDMVSNGYLLDDKKAEELVKSGLSFLQISLDSSNSGYQDMFRNKEGAFSHALRAIKIMSKYKIALASAFCPTRLRNL